MSWRESLAEAGRRVPGGSVTVGVFDGGHLGHRALINVLRAAPPAIVVTFDVHPRAVLGGAPPEIDPLSSRLERLASWGADAVTVLTTDPEVLSTPAEDFAISLAEAFRPRAVVIGPGFRFGAGRSGGAETLRRLGAARGFDVVEVPPVLVDGAAVSSTRLRAALGAGDLTTAARLLGRPFVARGRVVPGGGRGRRLGAPTANIDPPPGPALADGVYAVRLTSGGAPLPGAANLGRRPTFGGGARTLEVHLLEGDPPGPGAAVEVEFVRRLRPEQRFETAEALAEQIRFDSAQARDALR